MDIKLAENIRTFRKQLSLTQEQLAEVLGVTVGAVYKWEARLSQPELAMIMAMADFFRDDIVSACPRTPASDCPSSHSPAARPPTCQKSPPWP